MNNFPFHLKIFWKLISTLNQRFSYNALCLLQETEERIVVKILGLRSCFRASGMPILSELLI